MVKIDSIIDPVLDHHLEWLLGRLDSPHFTSFDEIKQLKEYRTVGVKLGRQVGKSLYIARTARPEDVIFTLGSYLYNAMVESCKVYNVSACNRIYPTNCNLDVEGLIQDIWVDDASFVPPDQLEHLYKTFAGKCRRFILIG